MAPSIVPFKTHFNQHSVPHSWKRQPAFGQTSARPFKLIPSGSGRKFFQKILNAPTILWKLQSLLRVNEQTRRRMEVSILPLSNHILTARHAKLSTPLETSARFLSAIIPTQTVWYCDSSSKWTISKMLYCYFNPLRLIFPFAWHFFHSVSSHCAKALFRLRFIPGIWKWEWL